MSLNIRIASCRDWAIQLTCMELHPQACFSETVRSLWLHPLFLALPFLIFLSCWKYRIISLFTFVSEANCNLDDWLQIFWRGDKTNLQLWHPKGKRSVHWFDRQASASCRSSLRWRCQPFASVYWEEVCSYLFSGRLHFNLLLALYSFLGMHFIPKMVI